jgi:hypothetical protein
MGMLLVLVLNQPADAKELNEAYEAVMHIQSSHSMPVLDDGDHVVGIAAFRGIAIFPEDNIAGHRYDGWFDLTKGSGTFHGYALWTFEDGSELRADYSGEARDAGADGFFVAAKFRDFSGTGRFKGATGEGSFAGRRLDSIDKGGSTYLKGKLRLRVPD